MEDAEDVATRALPFLTAVARTRDGAATDPPLVSAVADILGGGGAVVVDRLRGADPPTVGTTVWGGLTWSWSAPSDPAAVVSVDCSGPSRCYAVGHQGFQRRARAAFWDGAGWSAAPAQLDGFTSASFSAVACGAPGSCWIFGQARSADAARLVIIRGQGRS